MQKPGGIQLEINGQPFVGAYILDSLPYGATRIRILGYRGPMQYEHVFKLQAASLCDPHNVHYAVYLKASFVRPCNRMGWSLITKARAPLHVNKEATAWE